MTTPALRAHALPEARALMAFAYYMLGSAARVPNAPGGGQPGWDASYLSAVLRQRANDVEPPAASALTSLAEGILDHQARRAGRRMWSAPGLHRIAARYVRDFDHPATTAFARWRQARGKRRVIARTALRRG